MSWIIYSLGAAVTWGLLYAVTGEVIKKLSMFSILSAASLFTGIFFFIISYFSENLSQDLEIIKKDSHILKYLLILLLANVAGNFFLFVSIRLKNATAAGMIEISYPLFTALFAWILFKQNNLSFGLIIGGLLIASGVICIMYFDKTI